MGNYRSGVSNREMKYGHFDTDFLRRQIEERRQDIDQCYANIEEVSSRIDGLYERLKTAKGSERRWIYKDIETKKNLRSSIYDLIQHHKDEIKDLRDEINDYRRR